MTAPVVELSLSNASFFLEKCENLDVEAAVKVVDHEDGWHLGATLDVDDKDIDELIAAIDDTCLP